MLGGQGMSTTLVLEQLRHLAVSEGARIARKVFEKRGNHTEAHLDETTLAALLGTVYELGYEACARHRDANDENRDALAVRSSGEDNAYDRLARLRGSVRRRAGSSR